MGGPGKLNFDNLSNLKLGREKMKDDAGLEKFN